MGTDQMEIMVQDGKPLIEMRPLPESQSDSATLMRVLEKVALDPAFDPAKLDKLLAVKERWDKEEARKAFAAAMAAFKAEDIHVTKDKVNKQYSNADYEARYTSIGNLVKTVTPFLSKHGLSASWDLKQVDGSIVVSCKLTHELGHSGEPVSLAVPPDKSGSKNPLQEIKSAITYAKICTFESAVGLASEEGNLDDDGNASGRRGGGSEMNPEELTERLEHFPACATMEELRAHFEASYVEARKKGDKSAMDRLIKAKNQRVTELRKAGTR